MPDGRQALTGWGLTAPTVARLVDVGARGLPALVARADERGIIARGLGRSYADASQNSGGTVLSPLEGETRIEHRENDEIVVHTAAGTSLHDLMRLLLRRGMFVTVTPGTRHVTVGGSVACDIHGKNHHRDGSFGSQVVALDLFCADQELRTIGPDRDPELFWATVGGMGLTGVITSVSLRARRVESAWMSVDTERMPDLASLMRRMRESDADHHYSVAWIDTLARGRQLGRSVLTRADHARAEQLTSRAASRNPWLLPADARLSVPLSAPSGVVSRPTVRMFNELWYRKARADRAGELQSISGYFHPLDGVRHWNRLYGRRGLVQYQLVVPDDADQAVAEALTMISAHGAASFLAVLKRFGEGNPGLLSFPMAGWTLALDLPASSGLVDLFARLDVLVADAGGRVYLAKDGRVSRGMLERMYPRLERFHQVRHRVDPERVFQSDLARRLGL